MKRIFGFALTVLVAFASNARSEDFYYLAGGLTNERDFNSGLRISADGRSIAIRHVWMSFDNDRCRELDEDFACRSFQGMVVAAPKRADGEVSRVGGRSAISCREESYGSGQTVWVCVARSGSMKTKTLSTPDGDVISISINEADVVQTFVCAGDRRFSLKERKGKGTSSS